MSGKMFKHFCRRKTAVISMAIIILYVILAVYTGIMRFFDFRGGLADWQQQTGQAYQAPCPENLLGTDFLGQSTLRKTACAAGNSVLTILGAGIIVVVLGISMGAAAGYFGGIIDDIIVWIYSTVSTIPWILLMMALAIVLEGKGIFGSWGGGNAVLSIAIGLTGWVGLCRIVRGEFISRKQSGYVLAAKAIGCSDLRIIFLHILPNITGIIAVYISMRMAGFLHAQVVLNFLGLGTGYGPSWGEMINAGRSELWANVWWEIASATAAVFILSLTLNIVADTIRDICNPKIKKELL